MVRVGIEKNITTASKVNIFFVLKTNGYFLRLVTMLVRVDLG